MNPRYKLGILAFGVIGPLLVLAVILGILASQKAKITKEFETRKAIHLANQRSQMQAKGIQAQLVEYEERQKHWDALLKQSDVGSVTGILKEISSEYAGTETFKQNDFKFVNRETGIGAVSQQPSVSFNVSLSGTFQALQQSLLSLESQLPNLSLNAIKLEPRKGGQLLEAELTYSAWIN